LEVFFELVPGHLKLSLTVDRGSEFAEHREFEKSGKGMPVYFCDAYCSWQKGSVENSNREFRKHFAKGTDFSKISAEEIFRVQNTQEYCYFAAPLIVTHIPTALVG